MAFGAQYRYRRAAPRKFHTFRSLRGSGLHHRYTHMFAGNYKFTPRVEHPSQLYYQVRNDPGEAVDSVVLMSGSRMNYNAVEITMARTSTMTMTVSATNTVSPYYPHR